MTEDSLAKTDPFQIAGYLVEPSILRVTGDATEARLEARAMQVLVYLVENPGNVVSRAELEKELWPGRIVTEDSVTNAISKLRRVFGDDARQPRVIETIPKSGYRLIAEVIPAGKAGESGSPPNLSVPANRQRWKATAPWIFVAVSLLLLTAVISVFLDRRGGLPARPGPPSHRPAVAVLPFDNLGATPEQDYFANGITADLITDLSKLEGLSVIAPGSADAFKAAEERPRQAYSEPEVDYLILGSVQRQRDRLRINIQLIEVSAEQALWGERYDGPMNEIFDVQDRLTAAVVKALKVELAPEEQVVLTKRPTASVAAYDHYLQGIEDHGGRTQSQNSSARSHFEKAIELDPAFARAYAGLAMTHSRDAIDGWTATPSKSLDVAAELAEKATILDPSLPQVHFASGQVDLFRRRHEKAVAAVERAIAVNPNYADAYALLAWILSYAGRPVDALSALNKAMYLNPRPPASYLEILGEIRFTQGRYEESASTFQRVLDINPGYSRARMWSTAALALAGLGDRAEWEAAELLATSPDFALERLAFAFPFKDLRALDSILDGLKKAGLPDRYRELDDRSTSDL